MTRRRLLWILLALAGIAVYRSALFVDETEFVIVTQFGRPVATLRDAGLALKLPYQSALRIDRRLQVYNPRPSEFLADEKKNQRNGDRLIVALRLLLSVFDQPCKS